MKIDKYFHLYGTKDSVVFEEIEQPEKDLISRKEATRHLKKRLMETALNNVGIKENADYVYSEMAENRIDIWMDELPSAQPEVTEEAVKEYCRKRCLCIVDSALLKKYASGCGADMRGDKT